MALFKLLVAARRVREGGQDPNIGAGKTRAVQIELVQTRIACELIVDAVQPFAGSITIALTTWRER